MVFAWWLLVPMAIGAVVIGAMVIARGIDSNIAGKPAPTMAIGGESPMGERGIA